MACDVCGKAVTDLVALREAYQGPTIKMVCRDCETEANKKLWEFRKIAQRWTEQRMRRWAGHPDRELPWWKRLFR